SDYWLRGLRALGGFDGKAFFAEPSLDGIGQTGLVLDQQDAERAHTLDAGTAARLKKAPATELERLVHGELFTKPMAFLADNGGEIQATEGRGHPCLNDQREK